MARRRQGRVGWRSERDAGPPAQRLGPRQSSDRPHAAGFHARPGAPLVARSAADLAAIAGVPAPSVRGARPRPHLVLNRYDARRPDVTQKRLLSRSTATTQGLVEGRVYLLLRLLLLSWLLCAAAVLATAPEAIAQTPATYAPC